MFFSSLLAMIAFSKNFNGFEYKGESLSSKQQYLAFKKEMRRLENQYTNYGCYCYATGVQNGVHGGGKPRDIVDQHCKDLYNCYRVSYFASFMVRIFEWLLLPIYNLTHKNEAKTISDTLWTEWKLG